MVQDECKLLRVLYEDYLVPLKKLAMKLGVNSDDIEDLTHDTILAFYDRYPLDWNDKQKRAMLARILHNKCMDNYRKNHHYADISVDNLAEEFLLFRGLVSKDALAETVDHEACRIVQNLVISMKKDWRDVIILYAIEGRPIDEVCRSLGISEPVCRSRIARARKNLRSQLKDMDLLAF
ncbi:MAG: RNA polymerase sigma factor [Clostridium sp.]